MGAFRLADNKLFSIDGHNFIFLAEENAIYQIEAGTKDLLQKWSSSYDPETLPFGSEEADSEESDLLQDLLRRRVIVRTGEPEKEGRPAGSGRLPINTLVLNITESCNLACLYCYHHRQSRTDTRPMTQETAQKAVDFLFEQSGGLEKVVLVFFGGEPLLNFGLIRATVNYALNRSRQTGKKVDFALTSNGSLLTDSIIRFLMEHNIGVTVSIDGYRAVHDQYRRFPDGRPSYEVILPRVQKLLAEAGGRPVVARVTVVKSAAQVTQTLEHLLELGFSEVGFAPVTTDNPDFQLDPVEMDRLLDQFGLLADRLLESGQKDAFFGFTNLIDLLVMLHQGEIKRHPCGAGLGLFAVDAAGRLFLCQRLTGDDRFCMGDIDRGLDKSRLERFRAQGRVKARRACRACWARVLCAGGCYHEALVREGDITRPNLHYCQWIRKWLETGLKVYARLAVLNPGYLDRLSIWRGSGPVMNLYGYGL